MEDSGKYRYTIDEKTGLVHEVLSGNVTMTTFAMMIQEMFQDPDFRYARHFLCDYTGIESIELGEDEEASIADNVQQLETTMPGVKLAFVVSQHQMAWEVIGRFFERMKGTGVSCQVFSTVNSAMAWLGVDS